jgi:uncharacterized protein YjbJ (UPF0337 family)
MGENPQELSYEPHELRHDIERTREGMDATLNQIEDRISPSRIVERRKARMRDTLAAARERVMGSADGPGIGARAGEASDELGERVEHLQEEGKRRYQGNPLAAGMIAFGAGALLGSLLPRTEPEQQVAGELKERVQPAVDELRAAGTDMAEDLKTEAQERMEDVKATAGEAATAVKDDARGSAEHVRADSEERAGRLKDDVQR